MTLSPITDDALLPVTHGFFTRAGGVSSGLYAGLNCGLGSKDRREDVVENRSRVAAALGVSPDALCSVHQVHSADVVTVHSPSAERPKADAMVTATKGIALGVLTADCAPVLFADQQAGVIGAAHAGWGGAFAGVLEATAKAMRVLGARQITAVVGPTISQANYEVGPEFLARFLEQDPDNDAFFKGGAGDRSMFDLPAYVVSRLHKADVTAHWTGHCTYADPARFYSYRRATHNGEADYGRMIACIGL